MTQNQSRRIFSFAIGSFSIEVYARRIDPTTIARPPETACPVSPVSPPPGPTPEPEPPNPPIPDPKRDPNHDHIRAGIVGIGHHHPDRVLELYNLNRICEVLNYVIRAGPKLRNKPAFFDSALRRNWTIPMENKRAS